MLRPLLILFCFTVSWANADTFVVALEDADNKPFEYFDDSRRLTGFHVELVRTVAATLGWDVKFIALPWKRVIAQLESGSVDAAIYVAASPKRKEFAYFLPDNLLHLNGAMLYIKKSRAKEIRYFDPLEAFVARWNTGFPDGYYMSAIVQHLIEEDDVIKTPTVNQSRLFSMLQTDRYDAVFGSVTALSLGIHAKFKAELQPLDNFSLPPVKMYIAFPRSRGLLRADRFARAYRNYRLGSAYGNLAKRFEIDSTLPHESDFEPWQRNGIPTKLAIRPQLSPVPEGERHSPLPSLH